MQHSACLVFLDVSNAFPTVSHHILISKMQNYGFARNVVKWFESYLSGRDNVVGDGEGAHIFLRVTWASRRAPCWGHFSLTFTLMI